jgi:hypothetical protein
MLGLRKTAISHHVGVMRIGGSFLGFLPLTQFIWGRHSMSSFFILLYRSSVNHSTSFIPCLTQLIHLFLGRVLPPHPSTVMFITLLVAAFSNNANLFEPSKQILIRLMYGSTSVVQWLCWGLKCGLLDLRSMATL